MNKELATLPPEARAQLALGSTQTEIDLRALAIKNVTITQVVDKAGRQQAHGAAMELRTARTDIEKLSKATRDDAVKFGKACIAEEARLISIIQPEEARLVGLRDAWDNEQARIKAEAEAKERTRITAIHERIAEIRGFATLATQCRTAARIAELLAKLQAFDLTGFEEFTDEAIAVHVAAVAGVTFVHGEKVAEEAERARVRAQQEADAAALKQAQAEQAAAAAQLASDRAALEKERAELAAAKAATQKAIEDAKPKDKVIAPEPDAYEQELQAFAAVVTPQPVSSIHAAPEPKKADLPNTTVKPTRPTDLEIVEVLSNHYRCHELRIVDWLLSMDLDTVGKELAAEFV